MPDSLPTTSFAILLNGKAIDSSLRVSLLETDHNISRIATARIILAMPVRGATGVTSTADGFIPGQTIEISLGNRGKNTSVFKGIIVNLSIRNQPGGSAEMVIQCSDKAIRMTAPGWKSACYQHKKDSEIMQALVSEYQLEADVEPTAVQHPQLVKYQASDWEFLLARAEANGLLVYTEDGKVVAKKPAVSGSPKLSIEFEKDVLQFDCGVESRFQSTAVTCSAWDIQRQAVVRGNATEPRLNAHGDLKGKDLANSMGMGAAAFGTTSPLSKPELEAWANAALQRERMNSMQGQITFLGNARPKLNTLIEMKGFGKHFDGDALITRIQHRMEDGIWHTTTDFGLPPQWQYTQETRSAPAAAGLLPAISGLQNGVVKKTDADPDGQFRILVDVPLLMPNGEGIWARMAHFYATPGKGSFFLPEVGDEVVLGFLNDDPRFPVILGMLYSSKIKPAYAPDAQNALKAIITRSDLRIEFNDKDKILSLKTPAGNQYVMSEKDKSIVVKDQHGNVLEMNTAGISISSVKNLVLKAANNLTLQAGNDVLLNGQNVKAEARAIFSASAIGSAKLESSAVTEVKGALVKIN